MDLRHSDEGTTSNSDTEILHGFQNMLLMVGQCPLVHAKPCMTSSASIREKLNIITQDTHTEKQSTLRAGKKVAG